MLTGKQEKFAQGVAKGLTQADAYKDAYDCENMKAETITNNAYKLMQNNDIATRIEKLKERALKRYDLTIDDIIHELEEAREMGKLNSQPSAMVSASMGKAKLLGLITDKQEVKGNMNVTMMPSVKVDGKDLDINIGDEAND